MGAVAFGVLDLWRAGRAASPGKPVSRILPAMVLGGFALGFAVWAGGLQLMLAKGRHLPGQRTFSGNETSAIATLRNISSAQALSRDKALIDVDKDGTGEVGTFLELTGSAGVRKSPDWSTKDSALSPPLLSLAMSNVDSDGIVTKSGYCYRIYLPDTAPRAGFVHETGPAASAGFSGGTGKVHTDLAETTWCAYAWPVDQGFSGNRVFFVDQSGDVMESSNEVAEWSGKERAPPGNSAFLGKGITGSLAIGTCGQDGDVWKVVN
jgi:hypothetical protein